MGLVFKKTTKLIGELTVDGVVAKTVSVELDEKAIPTVTEWLNDEELYEANRKEMRKQKRAFDEKRFEIEDAILLEVDASREN